MFAVVRFLSVAGATVRAMTTLTIDWTEQLSEQLEWHWSRQLRPRFAGLSDDEYLWEPAQPAWNVRPRTGDGQPGTGPFTVEFSFPEPDPPPVTTIAWRLAHIIVGVLGARVAVALRRATGGLRELRRTPARPPRHWPSWTTPTQAGRRASTVSTRRRSRGRVGPAEGPFAEYPMAALVLHINREVIHHGAEVALLRDLYRARTAES